MRKPTTLLAGVFVAALALAGCGDSDDSGTAETVTVTAGTEDAAGTDGAAGEGTRQTGTAAGGTAEHTVGDDQQVRVTEETVTVRCSDGDVIIAEGASVVTMTGRCDDVRVEVSDATITAEGIDDLDVYGSNNTITAGVVDDIEVKGNGNTVMVQRVDDVEIEGNDNAVAYREGSPEIEDKGSNNTVGQG